jgi:hypothetical protein
VSSYAESKPKFIKIRTTLKNDQSLAKLYSKFVKENSLIRKSSPMTKKTFKANPKIKNWRKLKKETRLTLYINKAFLDPQKMDEFRKSLPKKKPKKKVVKKTKKQKIKHFSIATSGGMVSISDEDSNTLDMNFLKFSASYSNKLKKKYNYQVGVAAVTFFDLKYSQASKSAIQDGFLPEFNLAISRSFNSRLALGIGYDYLNYFVLSDASETTFNLDPKEVHRINVKPFYRLSSIFGLLSSVGHLTGAGSGIDASLGITASVGKKDKLQGSVALIGYFSSLEVEDRKESSSAIVVSFGFMI